MASRSRSGQSDKPSVVEDTQDTPSTSPQSEDSSDKPSVSGVTSTAATGPSNETDKRVLNNVLGSKVQKIKAINVKISEDKDRCDITGCCFMPGGELVLCDSQFRSGKIKLLDRSLSVVGSLDLPGVSHVAAIDDSNVIVDKPREKQLQFVQVLPTLEKGRTVDVGLESYGVAVAAGKIFVSCRTGDITGEIRIYDIGGKDLGKKLGVNRDGLRRTFRQPGNIAANGSGDTIFVSDSMTESVISCTTGSGKIVYQYKDSGLKAPTGLFVDDNDNVVVCGFYSKTLQVITSAGKKHKTILTAKDGISLPRCVSFRPSDGTLVVCCDDSDKIFVYKMS